MRSRPTSLRSALLLAAIAAILPMFAINFLHAASIHRQLCEAREAEAHRLAEQVAAGVGRYIDGTSQLLLALAHHDPIRMQIADEAASHLVELRKTSPLFRNLMLIAGDGTIIASAVPFQHRISVADRSYFIRLQANRRGGFGEYQIGRITGIPVINLACPLPGQQGTGPLACVAASLDLEVLQRMLDDFPRPAGTNLVLLDRKGVVLAQRGATLSANGSPFPGWTGSPIKQTLLTPDAKCEMHAIHFVPVSSADEGLWVGVGQLESAINHDAREAFLGSLAATSLFVVTMLALSWWIGDRLVLRPILRITDAAAALAAGDWTARARIRHGVTELRKLGETFDAMASHLHGEIAQIKSERGSDLATTRQQLEQAIEAQHAADAALRHSEATARTFIESIVESALLLSPDGKIILANNTAARGLGITPQKLIGSRLSELLSDEFSELRKRQFQEVLHNRQRVAFDDRQRDRVLRTELVPVLDAGGAVAAVAVVSFDITERCLMEEHLRRSVAELEKALTDVKTLSGLLPICANCKKIRDDKGYWSSVEQYIGAHTGAEFSHGLCPDCMRKLYPELAEEEPPPPQGESG
jgi:PAS domain S-box-containing protein